MGRGGPGGAGVEFVEELRGAFFTNSLDLGFGGPYASFEEALNHLGILRLGDGKIPITRAIQEISCTKWSDDELIRRLDLDVEDAPPSLFVNDTSWFVETLELRQQKFREIQDVWRMQTSMDL